MAGIKAERVTSATSTMARIREMQKQGIPEKEIAEALNMNTMSLRRFKSGYYGGMHEVYGRWIKYLKKEGKTFNEIASIVGMSESSVRLREARTSDNAVAEEA